MTSYPSAATGKPAMPLEDVRHWINAARFALYTRMHATAQEYLNKATLIASLSGSDDCSGEIRRLADELRRQLQAVGRVAHAAA
jgi:hypothetical protein